AGDARLAAARRRVRRAGAREADERAGGRADRRLGAADGGGVDAAAARRAEGWRSVMVEPNETVHADGDGGVGVAEGTLAQLASGTQGAAGVGADAVALADADAQAAAVEGAAPAEAAAPEGPIDLAARAAESETPLAALIAA